MPWQSTDLHLSCPCPIHYLDYKGLGFVEVNVMQKYKRTVWDNYAFKTLVNES